MATPTFGSGGGGGDFVDEDEYFDLVPLWSERRDEILSLPLEEPGSYDSVLPNLRSYAKTYPNSFAGAIAFSLLPHIPDIQEDHIGESVIRSIETGGTLAGFDRVHLPYIMEECAGLFEMIFKVFMSAFEGNQTALMYVYSVCGESTVECTPLAIGGTSTDFSAPPSLAHKLISEIVTPVPTVPVSHLRIGRMVTNIERYIIASRMAVDSLGGSRLFRPMRRTSAYGQDQADDRENSRMISAITRLCLRTL